jgi:hypothetical protein
VTGGCREEELALLDCADGVIMNIERRREPLG